jgi:transglutaminase-like putative cysteine protease
VERYFQISFHLLVLTGFMALVETGRLDIPSVLIFLTLFSATAYRTLKRRPPLLGAHAAFFLSLVYVFFFVVDALIISASFIAAIIHLILFLELAKLAQAKTDKDYLYLILLSFLQVLAASSLTIDMSFAITLFFFLVALVSTLMSFDIYRSHRSASNADTLPIGVSLSGMSVWAAIWIVVIGVALFFTIPRMGTGYFSRAATQGLLLSGFSDSVELGAIGEVKLSSALVMRTRLLDGLPTAAPKWRGLALDTFDGRTWSKSNRRRESLRSRGEDQYSVQDRTGHGTPLLFQVFLEPLATPALFGPHIIRSVRGDFRGLERDDANSVYQRVRSVRRTQYEVLSEIPLRTLAVNAAADNDDGGSLSPDEADVYLQLPVTLNPRIIDLADEVTRDGDTAFEKAALVETYLKTNYEYSLELNWDPGLEPLSQFLFDSASGHCEYFASSMAIMLRAVGIHTRVVNGFLPGEYNSVGDSYIIRQSDAHSWVEVYVPGQGWIEFDPTPPDPNRNDLSMLVLISHYIDAAELFWNAYILTYDSTTQFQLFRSAQDAVQAAQNGLRSQSDSLARSGQAVSERLAATIRETVETLWFWSLVGLIGCLTLWMQHRCRIQTYWKLWNLRHGRGNADHDVVTTLFYRVTKLAGARSGTRLPHQTWREWMTQLPDEGRRRLVAAALDVFEKARYGGLPVTTEEYRTLEQTLRELKGA